MDELSKVYIKIDDRNRILAIDGGYTLNNITDIENWTLIDEGAGDRFNLCQTHYLSAPVVEAHGAPQFAYIDEEIIERTATEIEADINENIKLNMRCNKDIIKGECVSIQNALYKAICNVPRGERIIVGENVIVTDIITELKLLNIVEE